MSYEFDRTYIEEVIMLSALALFLIGRRDTRLSDAFDAVIASRPHNFDRGPP